MGSELCLDLNVLNVVSVKIAVLTIIVTEIKNKQPTITFEKWVPR